MKLIVSALLVIFTIGCQSTQTAEIKVTPTTVEDAVNISSYRAQENRHRDQYRHPIETLNFFGVKPEMTILEVSPGAGWYQEILAPLLSSKGQYIAANPPFAGNEHLTKMNETTQQWYARYPEIQAKAKNVEFSPPKELAVEQPVDMILTFRNVHNWAAAGTDQAAFNAFFKALKPGGVLGVVEHRANPKSKRDLKSKSGYMRETDVIQMAKRAGFKLEAKSEINANPKDQKNYPEGVWTLPPTLKLKDKNKEKYIAIGESDRMTLKFIKP